MAMSVNWLVPITILAVGIVIAWLIMIGMTHQRR